MYFINCLKFLKLCKKANFTNLKDAKIYIQIEQDAYYLFKAIHDTPYTVLKVEEPNNCIEPITFECTDLYNKCKNTPFKYFNTDIDLQITEDGILIPDLEVQLILTDIKYDSREGHLWAHQVIDISEFASNCNLFTSSINLIEDKLIALNKDNTIAQLQKYVQFDCENAVDTFLDCNSFNKLYTSDIKELEIFPSGLKLYGDINIGSKRDPSYVTCIFIFYRTNEHSVRKLKDVLFNRDTRTLIGTVFDIRCLTYEYTQATYNIAIGDILNSVIDSHPNLGISYEVLSFLEEHEIQEFKVYNIEEGLYVGIAKKDSLLYIFSCNVCYTCSLKDD